MTSTNVLWDVDTQNDILLRSSKFAVPGGHRMMGKFGEAIRHYKKRGFLIMGTVDAHKGRESIPGTRDENLPLHCIKGTEGQLKIASTRSPDILYVSNQEYEEAALDKVIESIRKGKRVYFEKETQSCQSNPNIGYIFKKLRIKNVYLSGVLTNVCVRFADAYFKSLKIQTTLVLDAIKGNDFPGDTEQAAIDKMISTGTKTTRYRRAPRRRRPKGHQEITQAG